MRVHGIHEETKGIVAAGRRSKEATEEAERGIRGVRRNTPIPQGPFAGGAGLLVVVQPANQLEDGRACTRKQRLKQFDDGQEVDPFPMHRTHACHEGG
jgi:hypothetical protein